MSDNGCHHFPSGAGGSVARAKAMARENFGTRVVIESLRARPYPAKVREMVPRDRSYLPQGGQNVSFSDIRVYEMSPSDFLTGPKGASGGPAEGMTLTEQGQAFTVIGVPPADVQAGVPHTLSLICYRTPQTAEETADPTTGDRAGYPTPDATF